ncbi:MAG: FecR domain-containing protein [Methylophilus sp.]|nr:FecR domain-containing protein [Methylophilus sp.]
MLLCIILRLFSRRFAWVVILALVQPLSTTAQEVMWRYTVRPGDNLINLGKTHLVNPDTWREVQRINQIKNPYRIPVGTVLRVPLTLVKQSAATAEVIFVSGKAFIQQSLGQETPVDAGQKLAAGTQLSTRDKSKVVIRFADGTTATMDSNSILVLDSLSLYSGGVMVDTKLRLQQGQVETHANPRQTDGNRTQIITPTAIAAVRGTEFRVMASQTATTQETLDGQVAFSASEQTVNVDKGYGSLAELGKPPLAPVALLEAANTSAMQTSFEVLPVYFSLPPLSGAVTWEGKVSGEVSFNQIVAESTSNGREIGFGDLPDGQYYLKIHAKDQYGIAGYDATHPFIVRARPIAPNLTLPVSNSVVRVSQPELIWQPVTDTQRYVVQLSKEIDFKHIVETQQTDKTTIKLNHSLEAGQYYWRVASVSQNQEGPFTNVSQFTYKPAPPIPDISQLKVKVMQNRVYVDTLASPVGLTYEVHLDNDQNHQKDVWVGKGLPAQFNFLLKEYGKQTLYIHYLDSDDVLGPSAVYEFYAYPQ